MRDNQTVSRRSLCSGKASLSAIRNAVRFSFALRFFYFGFWFTSTFIRENCTC